MKQKLLAALLIMGACCSINQANAATSATQTLSATLGSYVDISPDNTAVLTGTIDPNTGNLNQNLTSKFNIRLNSNTTLYLRATALSSTTTEQAFFKNGSNIYVTLANTTNKPTVAAITNAKSATPDDTQNANVIAYPITGVTMSGTSASVTPNYNATTNQYEIAALTGASGATTTISQTVVPNTYSYLDTAGTYQAVVTLTSSPT